MPKQYSQLRAMLAITVASLRATLKSPQSVFFGLFFPVVLIMIFGSLGGGGGASVDVAFEKNVDSTNELYFALKGAPSLQFVSQNDPNRNVEEMLKKGRITAVINISPQPADSSEKYALTLRTTQASAKDLQLLRPILNEVIHNVEEKKFPGRPHLAKVTERWEAGREYKMIDFFLPGMIGFSLIGAAVFGVAFLFYSLRETLVLKRMYSTPIKRGYIIMGESLSRVIFQLMVVVVLVVFGKYMYGFTLANGWLTFVDMLVLSFLALLVFMGFGFFIASVARNQTVIPIYANLFMFPQYFLSGTFFSRDALPAFLQPVLRFLPLTALNDAMRKVAFEGAGLGTCWQQLLILAGWGIVVYAATVKVFKWE